MLISHIRLGNLMITRAVLVVALVVILLLIADVLSLRHTFLFNLGQVELVNGIMKSTDSKPRFLDAEHFFGMIEANDQVHYARGRMELARGNLRLGQELTQAASATRSGFGIPLLMVSARLASENGMLAQAVETYQTIIALQPGNAEAHWQLAYVLRSQRDYVGFAQHLEIALRLSPTNPTQFADLAGYYNGNGLIQKAKYWIDLGLHYFPSDEVMTIQNGYNAFLDKRYDDALAILQPLLSRGTQYPNVYFVLIEVYEVQGKSELAHQAVQQAVILWPDLPGAQRQMALVLIHRGKYTEAIPYALQAVKLSPMDALSNYTVGYIYVLLQRPEMALEYYQQSVRLAPDSLIYTLALADLYAQMGNRVDAFSLYQRAFGLDTNGARRSEIETKIISLGGQP